MQPPKIMHNQGRLKPTDNTNTMSSTNLIFRGCKYEIGLCQVNTDIRVHWVLFNIFLYPNKIDYKSI